MPEGDTIFRTARTLRRALDGGEVTDVRATVPQVVRLGVRRLVGLHVARVEPRGKHLLIGFAPGGLVLHTHLGMSGSWHLYRATEQWRKAPHLARFVLGVCRDGDWTAVCFLPRVCELLTEEQVRDHPVLRSLGPDPLVEDNLDESRRRLDADPDRAIGDALLDQRVIAGVGNVYRNEVLFVHGVHPWTTVGDVPQATRDDLLQTAARLLRQNATATATRRVTTGATDARPQGGLYVYGQARRPCPRCATPIAVARQGDHARLTYWCPRCQRAGPQHTTERTWV